VIAQFRTSQFLTFLVTGGLAAMVNFASRLLLNQWLSFSTSVVLAYLLGMATAFVLARLFVFKDSKQPVHHSIAFFVAVNLAAIVQTWGISMLLAYYALPALDIHRFAAEIAHAVGIVVPVFTSYLGHKRWSFR
jgi:putative flippase GtrA